MLLVYDSSLDSEGIHTREFLYILTFFFPRVTGRNNENHNLGIFVHCFFYSGVQGTADVGELYTEQTPGLGSEKKKIRFQPLGIWSKWVKLAVSQWIYL